MKKLGIAAGVAVVVALVVFAGIEVVLRYSMPRFQDRSDQRVASLDIVYSESSRCEDCHQDIWAVWLTSAHKTVSCETCHGPQQAHVDNTEVLVPVDKTGQLCLLCHTKLESKPSTFPQIVPADHYSGQPCLSCHSPYWVTIAEAPVTPNDIPHKAALACLSCHKAGVLGAQKLDEYHEGATVQMCPLCHQVAK
jgi:hypothetical protein